MKKLLTTALFFAGSLTSAIQAQDKSLLYEVTGPGLAKPSYLYGTFHLVCPADLKITDAMQTAYGNAQQVYLELDLDDPALMGQMQKVMTLSDGKTIKDFLKPEEYTVLDNYLKQRMNMNLSQVGTLKPFGLMSLMYMTLLKCQPQSYDLTFAQMAAKDKKEVLGLETLDAQMAAIEKMPMETQIKALVDMARKPDEASQEFTSFMAAYKAQDVAKLMESIKNSQFGGGMAEFEDDLLNRRNENWIPVIEKAAREKPTLFAFGAGHLGNEKGVINLLRKKGYTVKPVQ